MTTPVGIASADEAIPLPNGGSISSVASAGLLTLYIHNRPDLASSIQVPLDETVADRSDVSITVVAEVSPHILILQDAHQSKPGDMSFCIAGSEVFLRVISLQAAPEQSLQVKLSSCVSSIDLDDPGVVWNPAARTLLIQWLSGEQAEYRISIQGTVQNDAAQKSAAQKQSGPG